MKTLPTNSPLLCIGAANLDRKLRPLAALRMGTSNPASGMETQGGVARNIAENLARLGAPVALLTALGDDAAGQSLLTHAAHAGIDMRASLRLAGRASGTCTAVLDRRGELLLALADMDICEELTPEFLATHAALLDAAALVVADLNLPQASLAMLLRRARDHRAPLVLVAVSQPKMARLPADLRGLDVLILNRGELEARIGRPLPGQADLGQACRAVLAQGARRIVVTCGAHGVYYSADEVLHHLPASAAEPVDVTGAGDAFAAALCWSVYQDDGDLALACQRGLALAALTLASNTTVSALLTPGMLDHIQPTQRRSC